MGGKPQNTRWSPKRFVSTVASLRSAFFPDSLVSALAKGADFVYLIITPWESHGTVCALRDKSLVET